MKTLGISLLYSVITAGVCFGENHALKFDGADDGVVLENPMSGSWQNLTWEAWIQPALGDWEGAIMMFRAYYSDKFFFVRCRNGICEVVFRIFERVEGSMKETFLTHSIPYQSHSWIHVAATYDGVDMKLFINGEFARRVRRPEYNGWLCWDDRFYGFYLGGNLHEGDYQFFGLIDEPRVWSIARDELDIKNDMHRNISEPTPDLLGAWSLDEGEGQLVNDASGNNKNGRLGNSTEADSSDPTWVDATSPVNYFEVDTISRFTDIPNPEKGDWVSVESGYYERVIKFWGVPYPVLTVIEPEGAYIIDNERIVFPFPDPLPDFPEPFVVTVKIDNHVSFPVEASWTVFPMLSDASDPLFNSATGNHYELVLQTDINWTESRLAASRRYFAGFQGYLTTITSKAENDFLGLNFSTGNVWIGGSDSEVENEWRWMTGPEAGTLFWRGRSDGTAYGYESWGSGEPNNANNEEHCLELREDGNWNDVSDRREHVRGYCVEYNTQGGIFTESRTPFFINTPDPVEGDDYYAGTGAYKRTIRFWGVPYPVLEVIEPENAEIVDNQHLVYEPPEPLPDTGYEFTVAVKAVNDEGSVEAAWKVTIRESGSDNEPPEINNISAVPSTPCLEETQVEVMLACSATDPDSGPDPLTYLWQVTKKPPGSNPAFVPQIPREQAVTAVLDAAGDYTFLCSVFDGIAATLSTVEVTVQCGNTPPDLVLGLDSHTVTPGGVITADASASTDADNDSLSFTWEAIDAEEGSTRPIDLTGYYNVDVVYEPGGRVDTGGIDVEGKVLYAQGVNGATALPADGKIGEYQLAPYDSLNALQFSGDSADLTIQDGLDCRGLSLRYLVTGGNGDSNLSVEIVYEDATVQQALIYCDDWFDDDPPSGAGGGLRSDFLTPVIDGLDRGNPGGAVQNCNDPGIFAGSIELEHTNMAIKEIIFRPRNNTSFWTFPHTLMNIFGIWIVEAAPTIETPYADSTNLLFGTTEGKYRFRITVDDGRNCLSTVSEEFNIWVTSLENERPVALLTTYPSDPLLHLADNSVNIVLDATASYDPDAFPEPELSYAWEKTSGPGQGFIQEESAAGILKLTFSSPGTWIFQLNVNDGSEEDRASITISVADMRRAFIRGDANTDGRVDLADAVYSLSALFRNGPEFPCRKAADSNDNGEVDLTDAIYLLNYFFSGGAEPVSPFPECGRDSNEDELTCEMYEPCEEFTQNRALQP